MMPHEIIEEVRRAFEASRLTWTELARRTGTSRATCQRYLSGEVTPGLDVLDRLCKAVGLHLTVKTGHGRYAKLGKHKK